MCCMSSYIVKFFTCIVDQIKLYKIVIHETKLFLKYMSIRIKFWKIEM